MIAEGRTGERTAAADGPTRRFPGGVRRGGQNLPGHFRERLQTDALDLRGGIASLSAGWWP